MFNESTLNSTSVGSGSIPVLASLDSVAINSLGLQNAYIATNKIDDDTITEVNSYNNPLINGRGFLSNFKRGRNIYLTVTIRGDDQEDFLERLDNFRSEIYKEESTLSVLEADGEYRKIKVNCTSNPKNFEFYNITFVTLDVVFESLEPFWYKESYQSTSITGQTTNFTEEISNLGNSVSDPIIYLTFNTATVTEFTITLGDNAITITETIGNGDIIYIDGENKTVQQNGTEIDYSGTFPQMDAGANFFEYDVTGTFNLDTIILNRKNYV